MQHHPVERLVILLLVVATGQGLLCEEEAQLDNVTSHVYTIPHDPSDIDEYWRTRQFNFITFGAFSEDFTEGDGTTITAGYYTADNHLIYSTTVFCDNNTYISYITEKKSNPDVIVEYQKGTLETPCEAEGTFDLWFKVEQPQIMWFVYNAQPLQYGFRNVTKNIKTSGRGEVAPTKRLTPINSKWDGDEAAYFNIKTTGSVVLDQFDFGKCFTWPRKLGNNCTLVSQWLERRMKAHASISRGTFLPEYEILCLPYPGNQYYYWKQRKVHAQRTPDNKFWCCCTNMTTGRVYNEDTENYCKDTKDDSECTLPCTSVTYDKEIVQPLVDLYYGKREVLELEMKKRFEVDGLEGMREKDKFAGNTTEESIEDKGQHW